jgi:hypothetical protein
MTSTEIVRMVAPTQKKIDPPGPADVIENGDTGKGHRQARRKRRRRLGRGRQPFFELIEAAIARSATRLTRPQGGLQSLAMISRSPRCTAGVSRAMPARRRSKIAGRRRAMALRRRRRQMGASTRKLPSRANPGLPFGYDLVTGARAEEWQRQRRIAMLQRDGDCAWRLVRVSSKTDGDAAEGGDRQIQRHVHAA